MAIRARSVSWLLAALLAAVAALIDGSPMIANYHFAWFQARALGSEAADLR